MLATAHTIASSDRPRLGAWPPTLGRYRLHERLGAGGQACVYRARRIDDPEACDVALKRLHPHLVENAAAVRSFGREARIACLLDHPVIRRVLAVCREPGELFLIMEYVNGVSLQDVLQRASAARRPLPLPGILAVLHRLCDALHHAHERIDERGAPAGLVHRDVSPSNLIVTAAGRLKLIDMGVARSEDADHATGSGLVKGKYGYMAPEVMRGAPFDRRADVFSVGVVAWELLAGSRLFQVRRPDDVERVRARPVRAPSVRRPSCPPDLDAIVLRALAPRPADRWSTCAAMASALHDVAARLGEPIDDRSIAELTGIPRAPEAVVAARSRPPAAPPPERPRRWLALGAAGCLLVTVLVILASSALHASARQDADAPTVDVPDAAPGPPTEAPPGPLPVDREPLTVTAADVTWLEGRPPRSRSGSAPYRARLCIDTDGTVRSVTVLEGPARLARRIVRALRRWRYLPYRDRDGPRPVCFDVASRIQKIRRS